MNFSHLKKGAALGLVCSVLILSACGGSSESDDGNDEQESPNSSLNVNASLGLVTNASVEFYSSDSTTLLGSGDTGSTGIIDITYSSNYSGPIIVVVKGDNDATYFDEASSSQIAFGPGKLMRAIVPSGTSSTAVTALTEVAYQISVVNSIDLTNTTVNQLNERVRVALSPELTSIITPPFLFDSNTSSGSLSDSEAGKYALRLAALAQLGSSDGAPALKIMEQLAWDLSDGSIDGEHDGTTISGLVYSPASFVADLGGHMTTVANSFATTALQTAVTNFASLSTAITFSDLQQTSTSTPTLIADGDGAALSGNNGATGTVAGTTYTYTGHPVTDAALFTSVNSIGLFNAYENNSAITLWKINGFPTVVSSYACGTDGSFPTVSLTVGGVPYIADNCTIEVTSVSDTEVEGRFAASLVDASGNSLGTVTNGYFRYEVPVSNVSDSLGNNDIGYSMDVDGVKVTVNDILALDEFDRQVAGYVTLGDTPSFQINMIPDGETGTLNCGDGPAFRKIAMSYLGGSSENLTGSCSIVLTFSNDIYEATFNATLFTNDGIEISITNGFLRNDASNL